MCLFSREDYAPKSLSHHRRRIPEASANMKCRSLLGAYVWNERSNRRIKRAKLAHLIGCDKESIRLLEETGHDIEGILPRLVEVLQLDDWAEIFRRESKDKENALRWVRWCVRPSPPTIIAAKSPVVCPVEIPEEVAQWGAEAIENYAKDFARSWDRPIELFIRNHIRLLIDHTGEIVAVQELGRFDDWLDNSVS